MNLIDIVHASSEAAEAAAETANQTGLLASLGINMQVFIFQLINFAVVALILWWLILKPLTQKLAERQRIIDQSLENAKKVEENLAKSEEAYQKRLKEARLAAEKILEQAEAESGRMSAEMKAKAREEIEALVAQAKHNIKMEKEEMMTGLRRETADLVVLALEKILSEKMTDDKDKKFVKEILEKLR